MKLKKLLWVYLAGLIGIGSVMAMIGISARVASKKHGTSISKFENLIDVTGVPHDYGDSRYESRIAPFSDLGSWHAHSLPGYQDRNYWGGFTQPLIVKKTAPRSISKSLDQFQLYEYEVDSSGNIKTNSDNSQVKKLLNFRALDEEKVHIKQYPGGLWQEFEMENLTLQLNLRFTHQRTSTVKYNIINHTAHDRYFALGWKGQLFEGATAAGAGGAHFEDQSTISSHPYLTNQYGQPLVGTNANDADVFYYSISSTTNLPEKLTDNNIIDTLNHAWQGVVNNQKYYLARPWENENNDLDNLFTTLGVKFINKYNDDDQLNVSDPNNIIANSVSIKFDTKNSSTDNWLGHEDDWRWQMVFPDNLPIASSISNDGSAYEAFTTSPFAVEARNQGSTYVSTTFSFTAQERTGFEYESHVGTPGLEIAGAYRDQVQLDMANLTTMTQVFDNSAKRWDYYLDNLLGDDIDRNFEYQKVAVKGMESLITNWRGASGMIEHQGVTPSMSIQWFNSFWSWDSWKQASAAVNFDPKLAMDNIRVLYDYQVVDDPQEDFHYHFDPVRRKNDLGMIPDLVDYQQINTNWRDTKPPLSAWAIYNIYETVKTQMANKIDFRTGINLMTEVKDFLIDMYMRIMAYHAWWYQNRDGDGNGVVEYGATVDQSLYIPTSWQSNGSESTIVEAAAWESGMDNAPRFDLNGSGPDDNGLEFIANRNADQSISGYVLQQESVDLNAYMYAEKQYLIKIARALMNLGVSYQELNGIKSGPLRDKLVLPMQQGLSTRLKGQAATMHVMGNIGQSFANDIAQMETDSAYLKRYINTKMFDHQTGFYYDLKYQVDNQQQRLMSNDQLLVNRGKGPEGYIPLWAGVSDNEQADRVRHVIMDTHGFNTYLPFPTAAWDNEKFEPDQYWRGPVWLDQAYFGVQGLARNGFDDDASYMTLKLFQNAEGLLDGGPIRENYNPLTGAGLNAKGFSWSSGSYLLMYEHFIRKDR